MANELAADLNLHRNTVTSLLIRISEKKQSTQELLRRKHDGGRKMKLSRDNPGLESAALASNTGMSTHLATQTCDGVNKRHFGNKWNDEEHSVTRNTLMRTLHIHCTAEKTTARRRKQGRRDENSDWAIARRCRCLMTKEMLKLADKVQRGEMTLRECIKQLNLRPLCVDGISFADQHHQKQVIASGNGHKRSMKNKQWRISVAADGLSAKHGHGASLPKCREQIKEKHSVEMRVTAHCATRAVNGVREGRMLPPHNHTRRKLMSHSTWCTAHNAEIKHVRELTVSARARHGFTAEQTALPSPCLARCGMDPLIDERIASDECGKIEQLFLETQQPWHSARAQTHLLVD